MSNSLLQRLVVIFGKPETGDVTAYFAEVAKMLVKYTDPELERAGDLLVRTHRSRSFPTPSQIVTACEDVRASGSPTPRIGIDDKYPEWSPEAFAAADKLVKSEMGRRAAQEGWILGLHDYCRKYRELPSHLKIAHIQREAAYVTRCAAGLEDMGACHGALLKLAQKMLARREELAVMVLGIREAAE